MRVQESIGAAAPLRIIQFSKIDEPVLPLTSDYDAFNHSRISSTIRSRSMANSPRDWIRVHLPASSDPGDRILLPACRQAYALLRKPEISKVVAAAEKERVDENKVSAARVIEENRRIGLSDPRNFIDGDGNLKPVSQWTAEMAAAVSKIEVVKKNAAAGDGHIVKLWFWNKNQALDTLCKHSAC